VRHLSRVPSRNDWRLPRPRCARVAGLLHADGDPRSARRGCRYRQGVPGDDAWTAIHKGCAGATAAGEADADRRRVTRECRRLDSGGCRRRRCGIAGARCQSVRERPVRRDYGERAADRRERRPGERSPVTAKVITFGELMLRLGPPGFERLLQSPMLVATFGGGEANVAVSLAQFGVESYYVTRLPSNAIGDAAVRALRAEGVRTDFIVRGGSRMGIYFTETGASQRASTVLY